jgi:hypothetical protein
MWKDMWEDLQLKTKSAYVVPKWDKIGMGREKTFLFHFLYLVFNLFFHPKTKYA